VVNYLARLGWSHGDDEVFSVEQLTELFDLNAVGKSASRFDQAKLDWLNAHWIKESNADDLVDEVKRFLNVDMQDEQAEIKGTQYLIIDSSAI